ncbi:hypothetical protein GWI33_009099 [Rhynchophorus ferrugineus]|uniref:Uncharacterized protein n=1 Tax=Rhynchophorus ferrugineus TaxID=354439 RepID=A0A834IPU7_RHYFE|nr:hypothetical protein GWI33_009099 [Rhynchophorus ferrugineus]
MYQPTSSEVLSRYLMQCNEPPWTSYFIKYSSIRDDQWEPDLSIEDAFFRAIKVVNLGLPCLAYGIAAIYLIKHREIVHTDKSNIEIYFLYPEDKGSLY